SDLTRDLHHTLLSQSPGKPPGRMPSKSGKPGESAGSASESQACQQVVDLVLVGDHVVLACGVDHRAVEQCLGFLALFLRDIVDQHLDQDRKSTRLNSSHVKISYAVFC